MLVAIVGLAALSLLPDMVRRSRAPHIETSEKEYHHFDQAITTNLQPSYHTSVVLIKHYRST